MTPTSNKSSATAGTADRGVARAKNSQSTILHLQGKSTIPWQIWMSIHYEVAAQQQQQQQQQRLFYGPLSGTTLVSRYPVSYTHLTLPTILRV